MSRETHRGERVLKPSRYDGSLQAESDSEDFCLRQPQSARSLGQAPEQVSLWSKRHCRIPLLEHGYSISHRCHRAIGAISIDVAGRPGFSQGSGLPRLIIEDTDAGLAVLGELAASPAVHLGCTYSLNYACFAVELSDRLHYHLGLWHGLGFQAWPTRASSLFDDVRALPLLLARARLRGCSIATAAGSRLLLLRLHHHSGSLGSIGAVQQ